MRTGVSRTVGLRGRLGLIVLVSMTTGSIACGIAILTGSILLVCICLMAAIICMRIATRVLFIILYLSDPTIIIFCV